MAAILDKEEEQQHGAAKPVPAVKNAHRSKAYDEEEEPGIFQRHRALSIMAGIAILGGGIFAASKLAAKPSAPKREQTFTIVSLPPPPPPPPVVPPPPPPPVVQQEEKMIEQEPVAEDEAKPDDAPPDVPPDLGTSIAGDGPPDGFGLTGRPGGSGIGGSRGGAQRSRWGWYASQVQSKIQEALRSNRKTRTANLRVEVRVWPDQTGRITRAQLNGSTGDAAVDAALRNEVLTGLQLSEPPPAGMPSPIVLRLTARRP